MLTPMLSLQVQEIADAIGPDGGGIAALIAVITAGVTGVGLVVERLVSIVSERRSKGPAAAEEMPGPADQWGKLHDAVQALVLMQGQMAEQCEALFRWHTALRYFTP